MEMVKEMDVGNYYHQEVLRIDPTWTTSDVMNQLAQLAARTINPFLDQFESYSVMIQDSSKVTFAPKLTKEDGYLDFNQTASALINQLRALSEEPGCRFHIHDQEIKVFTATRCEDQGEVGEILSISDDGIVVACKDASIRIMDLQLPGKTRQSVREFIRGNTWLKAGMKGVSPHGRS